MGVDDDRGMLSKESRTAVAFYLSTLRFRRLLSHEVGYVLREGLRS